MALVSTLGPVLTIGFTDNNERPASMRFFLPPSANTVALALGRANALRDAIRPLTNARITGASLAFPLDENDGGIAPPESESGRKLYTSFIGANKRQTYDSELPSAVFTLELPQTDTIDTTNADWLAFVAAVVANAVTSHNEALVRQEGRPYIDHVGQSARTRK